MRDSTHTRICVALPRTLERTRDVCAEMRICDRTVSRSFRPAAFDPFVSSAVNANATLDTRARVIMGPYTEEVRAHHMLIDPALSVRLLRGYVQCKPNEDNEHSLAHSLS